MEGATIISRLVKRVPIDNVMAIDNNKGFAIVKLKQNDNSKLKQSTLLNDAKESSIIDSYLPDQRILK
jgi:hypothetical protein